MDQKLKQEVEEFIANYDYTKGGHYAHGRMDHNSTWIFTRMEKLLNIIIELEVEHNNFALHIARKSLGRE